MRQKTQHSETVQVTFLLIVLNPSHLKIGKFKILIKVAGYFNSKQAIKLKHGLLNIKNTY